MKNDSHIHHRKTIRLKDYDYSQAGYYFVTICTHKRENVFGEIIDGKMILNELGEIVEQTWFDLPSHNLNVKLDWHCIMPNHIHFIIIISDTVGAGSQPAPTMHVLPEIIGTGLEPAPTMHGLPEIVRQLKTFSAKRVNIVRNSLGSPLWQRNYFEHIIRNEKELYEIRKYIEYNPINWNNDEYNL